MMICARSLARRYAMDEKAQHVPSHITYAQVFVGSFQILCRRITTIMCLLTLLMPHFLRDRHKANEILCRRISKKYPLHVIIRLK